MLVITFYDYVNVFLVHKCIKIQYQHCCEFTAKTFNGPKLTQMTKLICKQILQNDFY